MDAMNQGNQTLANQILATLPSASQKIITATDFNTFSQCIQAIERFYLTDIEPYLENQQESWLNVIGQFSYKGVWSSGTSYETNNIVSYTQGGLTLLFIATSTPPVGTLPNNTNYWRTLTIQGIQGPSGVGLSYRQEWANTVQYNTNDCVSHNGALWMSLQPNINIQPGTNNDYWQMVLTLEATTYPIQASEPAEQDLGGLWFNTSENPTEYYYLETLDNPATPQTVWNGFEAYDATGNVITGEFQTYTEEEILSDSTKSSYSLSTSAVPNDVFNALLTAFQNYTRDQILSDTTKTAFGQSSSATPDTIFNLLVSAASGGVKIQTGSYVGTGTYGASNPCSLTFDFNVQRVIITDSGQSGRLYILNAGLYNSTAMVYYCSVSDVSEVEPYGQNFQFNGHNVQWSYDNPTMQLNLSANNYYYTGIG